MSKRKTICILATLALLLVPITLAQQPQPLTNQNIAALVRDGVSERVIIAVIQSGPTDFDTSAASLRRLNQRGVSTAITNAMKAARAGGTTMTITTATSMTDSEMTISPSMARTIVKATSIQPEVCGDEGGPVETMEDCHPRYKTGCSAAAGYDAYLNYLKNLLLKPTSSPVKTFKAKSGFKTLDDNTPETLTTRNHGEHAQDLATLGEGKIVQVVGYLYYGYPSGSESCNCGLGSLDAVDYHLGVGFRELTGTELTTVRDVATYLSSHIRFKRDDPNKAALAPFEQESVVVEMTPHYRAKFHPGWTVQRVETAVGRQVKIVGQLLIDNAHATANQICDYPDANMEKCWRWSAWEVHPVIEFYVCTTATPCATESPNWRKLEDLQ